jgi:hypothetical protein
LSQLRAESQPKTAHSHVLSASRWLSRFDPKRAEIGDQSTLIIVTLSSLIVVAIVVAVPEKFVVDDLFLPVARFNVLSIRRRISCCLVPKVV